jgi:hypothetical protein
MKTTNALVASLIAVSLVQISSAAPQPAPQHMMEVIVLDAGGNMQKLTELINRSLAIVARIPAYKGKVRAWTTTWAGTETGKVVVTVEFPSLADVATSGEALRASPEWSKWGADFQAAGMKILSESLNTELRTQ